MQRPRVRRASARSGFTLMEVSLAIAIVVIALLAMSASTLKSHSLRRQNRERAVAQNAVRMMAESIQSLSERLQREDPEGWAQDLVAALQDGGRIGAEFAVPELNRLAGADAVGRVRVIVDETTRDADLGAEIGMPRDLNGDGDAADADVTADARMLPVVVSAQWRGVSGTSFVRHPFYLVRY